MSKTPLARALPARKCCYYEVMTLSWWMGHTHSVSRSFAAQHNKAAVVFLATTLCFPQLLRTLVIGQVERFRSFTIIFHLHTQTHLWPQTVTLNTTGKSLASRIDLEMSTQALKSCICLTFVNNQSQFYV